MLTCITGKAGTGKTAMMMQTIARNVEGQRRSILIVPEQYSHQAERELCAVCGSRVSLYAEVLTFTGLARWTDRQLGSGEPVCLDKGGQLLCMALAVDLIYSQLQVYGGARKRAELQSQLLDAVTELKIACVSEEELLQTADLCEGLLGDKLRDLALILSAYDTVVAAGRADPTDRLTRLAQRIGQVDLQDTDIFIDGFTDFTGQQKRIITALVEAGCNLTVCLTCDSSQGNNEVYAVARSTLRSLRRICEEQGAELKLIEKVAEHEETPLEFFCDHMFTYTRDRMEDPENSIRLYLADGPGEECEFAAAQALAFVREEGCRWRDIAVAVRGFSAYESLLESAFRKYDVPLYITKRTPLTEKSLSQLIACAYEIIEGGWAAEDVFAYLRTGLAGLTPEECDVLENYVLLWDLRGNAWVKEADWRMHPEGYEETYTQQHTDTLRTVNGLRRRVAAPLAVFGEALKAAENGHDHVTALVNLLEHLQAADALARRADLLDRQGYHQEAAECEQVWEMTMSALEQVDGILGETEMDAERFSRLFLLMLGQYDVGTIPIAVDRVAAGEMDRMRRRNLKHLIVLGASDGNLPRPDESAGVFSADDRSRLLEAGMDLGAVGEAELWREFGLIYNCLTLPKETLIMTYPAGGENRPSVVMNRAAALFDKQIQYIDPLLCKTAAYAPALELAAFSLRGDVGGCAATAAAYFRHTDEDKLSLLNQAAEQSRGSLSRDGVKNLYGSTLRLSASRIDRFNACPFSYFMEYGLKAKPRKTATFAPPEMGTFMHYVLEYVARDVTNLGGFAAVSEERLHEITEQHIGEYIHKFLGDFKDKTPRFIYLFRRLTKDVRAVVDDMAAELRKSSFTPLAFELNFGDREKVPPMEIGEGDASLVLTGIADRVDGWVHDGKLYLRVVDYKTGKKEFKLSDIWYGMNLQMLLYLFTLEKWGEQMYGQEVVPAGVLYVPAFHKNVVGQENLSDEEIAAQQRKKHLRSGLILQDEAVIAAMEQGGEYEFIPVQVKKRGSDVPEALASMQQLGILAGHIDKTLQKLAAELKGGNVAAAPYYKSPQKHACLYCQYKEVCCFEDGQREESYRYQPDLPTGTVWEMMEREQEGGADNG